MRIVYYLYKGKTERGRKESPADDRTAHNVTGIGASHWKHISQNLGLDSIHYKSEQQLTLS